MTQPSRIQEILQEMESNAQLGEQLRDKILDDELRKLPTEIREHNRRLDGMLEELMQAGQNAQEQLAELKSLNETASQRMDRLEQDRSTLKNMTSRLQSAKYARTLARELNIAFVRSLDDRDLDRFAGAGITGGERRSFTRADLVIEGWAQWEEMTGTVYIAAEVSYTAAPRDAARAIRNAQIIAEATGRPCRPAVISVRNTYEVTEQVGSGQLHWYQLEERDLGYDEEE